MPNKYLNTCKTLTYQINRQTNSTQDEALKEAGGIRWKEVFLSNLHSFFKLGFALYLICGMNSAAQSNSLKNQSFGSMNEILRKDPNNCEALMARANAEAGALEDPQALEDYNKLLTLRPLSPDAYLHRSECYMHMGKFDLAEKDLRTCIKVCKQVKLPVVYPAEGEATMRLSRRLSARGQLKEALALMEQLSVKATGSREMIVKAQCECSLGLFDRAQADFDIGLKGRPNDPDSMLLKAECFMKEKKYESAIVVFTNAINMVRKTDNNFTIKDRFRLLEGRATAYRNIGKKALADRDLNESKRDRNELFDLLPFRDNSVETSQPKR